MELEPITHLEKSIAGTVAPVTHLEKVIEQYGGGGGGGGSVTPASIVTATRQMTDDQKAQTRTNINVQDTLVSGTNIKTINNQPILGSGNINISGGEAINVGNIQFDLVEESE